MLKIVLKPFEKFNVCPLGSGLGSWALDHPRQPGEGWNEMEVDRPGQYPSLITYCEVFTSIFLPQIFIETLHCVRQQDLALEIQRSTRQILFPLPHSSYNREKASSNYLVVRTEVTVRKDRYRVL